MEFIILVAVAVVFFFIGWRAREEQATKHIDNMFGRMQVAAEAEMKEKVVQIKIEKHDDTFFVYSLDDNSFMAQGTELKELEKVLADRFPGKMFDASTENLREVGFTNDSVK